MKKRVVDPFAGSGGSQPADIAQVQAGARIRLTLDLNRLYVDTAKIVAGAGIYAIYMQR